MEKVLKLLESKINKLEEEVEEAREKLYKELEAYTDYEDVGEYTAKLTIVESKLEALEELKEEIENENSIERLIKAELEELND